MRTFFGGDFWYCAFEGIEICLGSCDVAFSPFIDLRIPYVKNSLVSHPVQPYQIKIIKRRTLSVIKETSPSVHEGEEAGYRFDEREKLRGRKVKCKKALQWN